MLSLGSPGPDFADDLEARLEASFTSMHEALVAWAATMHGTDEEAQIVAEQRLRGTCEEALPVLTIVDDWAVGLRYPPKMEAVMWPFKKAIRWYREFAECRLDDDCLTRPLGTILDAQGWWAAFQAEAVLMGDRR